MNDASKRAVLKKRIADKDPFMIPGAFNAICAKFVEKQGFPCTYVSGSGTAAAFGLPDLGLTTLSEAVSEAEHIARAVQIPTIADADTGFGNVLTIPRTVRQFESAGLAGIHLEDQVFPKRCGHLAGKEVIPTSDMVALLKAALAAREDPNFIIIARVDAYSVTGFDDMLYRAQAYYDAGADLIFPEALQSLDEFEQVAKKVPVLANMTDFGKTPYFSFQEFVDVGCLCVLFPLTTFRACMKTMRDTLAHLHEHGSQADILDSLYTRQEYYDLIDYKTYELQADQIISDSSN